MLLRYRYRLEPNAAQRAALARAFGCARVVFNDGLRLREAARAQGRSYIPDGEVQRRVARLHARVKDTRHDWLHQASTALLRENQAVYVEDLAVGGLARTRLAKSVHDAGWGTFLRMLEEKAGRYGRAFIKVPRFAPTSRTCSACGLVDGPKPLSVRQWACPGCGALHDRDVNAAKNIKALGRRDLPNACGAGGSPRCGVAAGREAGTSDA